MREFCEFRINEDYAHLLFDDSEGVTLGESVRKIDVSTSDPKFAAVHRINEELRRTKGEPFFWGWHLYRKYAKEELQAAEAFHLIVNATFEPVGEECGTQYDQSAICPKCGVGRRQQTPLRLDLRRVPKNKDIARTLANEIIVSQRLAEVIIDSQFTGAELRPVRHKARPQNDPIEMLKTKAGWKLIQKAEKEGIPINSWQFVVWLNRPEQYQAWLKVVQEHAAGQTNKERKHPESLPVVHQLVVTSGAVNTVPPTKGGNDPFDEDRERKFKCPYGHTIGLNLLSEVHVARADWDESDFFVTKQMRGVIDQKGVLAPEPFILISPKARIALESAKAKGYEVEVAYFH